MLQLILFVGDLLLKLIDAYRLVLIVYFLLSWLPGAYNSKLGEILYKICEPYVGFFRRFIPPIGMISFAGVVAIIALSLIRSGVVSLINLLIRLVI